MPKRYDAALKAKPILQKGAQSLGDNEALEVKGIYEQWEKLVERGEKVLKGYKFLYGDLLCKTEQPEYTFVSYYIPGTPGVESLFSIVDEEHAGTINDPIPYSGNMALEQGKYYEQYGEVYLCNRNTGIAVHNDLKDLVNIYVEVA